MDFSQNKRLLRFRHRLTTKQKTKLHFWTLNGTEQTNQPIQYLLSPHRIWLIVLLS